MVHVNNIISGSNYQSDFILVSSPIFWLCMRVINEVIGKMYVCMYSLFVKASKGREKLNRVH